MKIDELTETPWEGETETDKFLAKAVLRIREKLNEVIRHLDEKEEQTAQKGCCYWDSERNEGAGHSGPCQEPVKEECFCGLVQKVGRENLEKTVVHHKDVACHVKNWLDCMVCHQPTQGKEDCDQVCKNADLRELLNDVLGTKCPNGIVKTNGTWSCECHGEVKECSVCNHPDLPGTENSLLSCSHSCHFKEKSEEVKEPQAIISQGTSGNEPLKEKGECKTCKEAWSPQDINCPDCGRKIPHTKEQKEAVKKLLQEERERALISNDRQWTMLLKDAKKKERRLGREEERERILKIMEELKYKVMPAEREMRETMETVNKSLEDLQERIDNA